MSFRLPDIVGMWCQHKISLVMGNLITWSRRCLPGFSNIMLLFSPFHTLFFGNKSLRLAHKTPIQRRGIQLCLLVVGAVIYYLEFLKEDLGSPALVVDLSLCDFRPVTQAFLVSGFPSIKWEDPWDASRGLPNLKVQCSGYSWDNLGPLQLERWVSSYSTCY